VKGGVRWEEEQVWDMEIIRKPFPVTKALMKDGGGSQLTYFDEKGSDSTKPRETKDSTTSGSVPRDVFTRTYRGMRAEAKFK